MHRWDGKAYKYKVVESTPTPEVTELDEYVFIVRIRIGEYTCLTKALWLTLDIDRKTSEPTAFVDIKSEGLRDILRIVLQDIKVISLEEDKPVVCIPFSVLLPSLPWLRESLD